MKTSDIDEIPILKFLLFLEVHRDGRWGTIAKGFDNSIWIAIPKETPYKLVLSKMRAMIKKGLVDGCGCGCRGDFEITDKGKEVLYRSIIWG